MPDPPASDLFTRYVLEQWWVSTALLVILGGVVLWRGLVEERSRLEIAGAIALVIAAGVALTGWLVTTAGEHATVVTREFVDLAVAGDAVMASRLLTGTATLNVGRPENPGMDESAIIAMLDQLTSNYAIERNSITSLRGYSADAGTGVAHLACWTETVNSYGQVPSQWVLQVRRQPDGSWKIARITCVTIAGRIPDRGVLE